MNVSPTSGVPIYRQLMDQVRAQIAGGRLAPGEFLPSVRQVAEELEVNPMTVSKAYSLLEQDGVVELVRGQGMRVLPMRRRQRQGRSAKCSCRCSSRWRRPRGSSRSRREQVIQQLKPLLEELDHE